MNYSANDNLEIMKYAKNYNGFLIKNVVSVINNYKFTDISDFGCADGFFMESISKIVNVNFTGIETDDTSYKTCIKKNLNVYKSLDETVGKFDLIYSFNVLEHIEDDVEILQKINDKLNKNGCLIVYVPALKFLFSSMDKKTGHIRRYTKYELTAKLKKTGFEIEKIEYCDSLGILATLAYILKDKIFKNNHGDISENSIILYDKLFPVGRLADKILFKNFCGKNLISIAKKKD